MIMNSGKLFDNFEIRDGDAHDSEVWSTRAKMRFRKKIAIENGLDSEVVVFVETCRDPAFSGMIRRIDKLVVPPNYQDYMTFDDPLHYVRVQVQATNIPTDGAITVHGA